MSGDPTSPEPPLPDPGDDELFDPKRFIKRLGPDELARFEPLSGLTLFGVTGARWREVGDHLKAGAWTDEDVAIVRTLDHEFYHFAQFSASGYCFDRQRKAFAILNQEDKPPETGEDREWREMVAAARAEAGTDPEARARIELVDSLRTRHRTIAYLDGVAAPGDHSMTGPALAAFFRHLEDQAARESVPNAAGLSILGLLEGSAVVFSVGQVSMGGGLAAQIEAELSTLPAVYEELYRLTARVAGPRALDLLLPSVAVSLLYERPHDAYVPVLSAMAANSARPAQEFGRALAVSPPPIPAAGAVLGTAAAVRARPSGFETEYVLYDRMFDALADGRWNVDAYALLAEPGAHFRIGGFPLGMVTADGMLPGPAGMEGGELSARLVLSSMVLRVQSRDRAFRDLTEDLTVWGKDFAQRMFSDAPEPAFKPDPPATPSTS